MKAFGLNLHVDDHQRDDAWITSGAQVAFRVDDLDTAHELAQVAGADVVHAPRDQPWGRSARYRDPDGNIVELTQPT